MLFRIAAWPILMSCILSCAAAFGAASDASDAAPVQVNFTVDENDAAIAGATSGAMASSETPEELPAAENAALADLAAGRYAALEQHFSDLQARYDDGSLSDLELAGAFGQFLKSDRRWQSGLDAWVAAYPSSYAAHLARGSYFLDSGASARGSKYASETPDAKFESMETYLGMAQADLNESLGLELKPIVSYALLIRIARFTSDDVLGHSAFDAGIALDPKSIIVRRARMGALQTRWGGSVQESQRLLDESRRAGVSAENLKLLQAQVLRDQAWTMSRSGDIRGAVDKYQQGADLLAESSPLLRDDIYEEILFSEGYAYEDLKDYPRALQLLQKAAAADPRTEHVWSNIAVCEEHMGDLASAITAYHKAAEQGDAWAMNRLGEFLYNGAGVPVDKKQALALFEHGAALGDADAIKNLYWAEKQMGITK